MAKYPRIYINGMDTRYFNAWTVGEDGIRAERDAVKVNARIEMSRIIAFDVDTHLTQDELADFDALCERVGQRLIGDMADALGKTP